MLDSLPDTKNHDNSRSPADNQRKYFSLTYLRNLKGPLKWCLLRERELSYQLAIVKLKTVPDLGAEIKFKQADILVTIVSWSFSLGTGIPWLG